MRAVLYTYEMEPLIIIDLPFSNIEELFERRYIQVPVLHKNTCNYIRPEEYLGNETWCRMVTIEVEKMYKDGKYYPLFFVNRQELHDALNLHPSEHFNREEQKKQERVTLEMLVDRIVPGLIKAFEEEQ